MDAIKLEKQINSPDAMAFEGTDAIFIPIDKCWGVKLFRFERVRDISYDRHAQLYDMGLAPQYGPKVDTVYKNDQYCGYLCELVECCDQAVLEYYGYEHSGYCGYCKDYDYFDMCHDNKFENFLNNNEKWGDAHLALTTAMEFCGIACSDMHAGNWGITRDGHPVMIDFDKCMYGLPE